MPASLFQNSRSKTRAEATLGGKPWWLNCDQEIFTRKTSYICLFLFALFFLPFFFFSYQDTKNPDFLVPIAEITEPLPPPKSDCPSPGPPGNTASKHHVPPALFLGMLCAVMAALK